MNTTIDDTDRFIITIPPEAHQIAQTFRAHQSDRVKGKQVYLNTLAVYAVHQHLEILGIDSHLDASDSWDVVAQSLLDTAGLYLDDAHQLECRPVLPDADHCYIPMEVWSDRQGYIAVQLDAELMQATLVGFLPQVATSEAGIPATEHIPLSAFHQLDTLMDAIAPTAAAMGAARSIPSRVTPIGQWLDAVIQAGWQTVESLLAPAQPAISFRSRPSSLLQKILREQAPGEVTQGRMLDFGIPEAANSLALVVGIAPISTTAFDIQVRVVPVGGETHLPSRLSMSILDEQGEQVLYAQSRNSEDLKLQLGLDRGDQFDVHLQLHDIQFVERFII
ncbi:MAG: DUF1822 family protein [Cyanobacteria bacterium P01_H01_bin.21]